MCILKLNIYNNKVIWYNGMVFFIIIVRYFNFCVVMEINVLFFCYDFFYCEIIKFVFVSFYRVINVLLILGRNIENIYLFSE